MQTLGAAGQDGDRRLIIMEDRLKVIEVETTPSGENPPNLFGVHVEDHGYVKSPLLEPAVREDGAAEVPHPNQGRRLDPIGAEQAADRQNHLVNVVAFGDVPEGTEGCKVAAQLCGSHADLLGKLMGIDVSDTFFMEFFEDLAVKA